MGRSWAAELLLLLATTTSALYTGTGFRVVRCFPELSRRAAEMGSLVARSNLATPRWLLRALLVVGPFAWYVLAPAAAAVAWRGGAAGLAKAAAALVGCRYAAGFALTLAVKRAA